MITYIIISVSVIGLAVATIFGPTYVMRGRTRDQRKAVQDAFQAVQDAKARNDDRDLGQSLERLRSARTAQLRHEVGR